MYLEGRAVEQLDGSLNRQLSIAFLDLDGLPDMADQWVDAVPPTPAEVLAAMDAACREGQ